MDNIPRPLERDVELLVRRFEDVAMAEWEPEYTPDEDGMPDGSEYAQLEWDERVEKVTLRFQEKLEDLIEVLWEQMKDGEVE